jgi:hypothetical protein
MVGLRAVAWHRCDHRPAAEKDLKPRPTVTCGGAVAGAAAGAVVHPQDAAPTPPARAGVPATKATRIAALDLAGIEAW